MNETETGKDKIKKICEILKNESLQPAKQEAQKIIEIAEAQAQEMIKKAEAKSIQIEQTTKAKLEKEKEIFQSSLIGACKQAVESLRQEIVDNLFNPELSLWINKALDDPKASSQLITALVNAIEKEGTSADFSASISKNLSTETINALLAKAILLKLKEKSVVLGGFSSGVQIKLHDKQLVLDMSETALKELLEKYLRKDFRKILFSTPG